MLDRLADRLGRFTFSQKVVLGAILAAGVISMLIFSVWLRQDEKAVLFTNLAPEDASLALQELAKQDIQADLANGGTTILVPAAVVHRLRVDLASKGIPSSGTVGFEIFDGKQYGLTDFLQNVNFKRALEGELTKSIESLAGIQSARVHLVLPKPSIFKNLQADATASVVLRLAQNARLSEAQIGGIQSLVSGSVEGLAVANVTVIDQNGSVLSRGFADEGVGRSENQLALKKEVETYLGAKAESMLAEVLGEGRSIVRVDATLNFEKIDTERETFDPEGAVVRSEERNEVTNPTTGGSEENGVTNYEINRTVERIMGQVGGVEYLSVAVFVDGNYVAPAEGEDPVYQPLSDDALGQIERIVQTAVGLNARRGDRIEVVNMQFRERNAPPKAAPGAGAPGWLEMAWPYAGRILLFALAAVLLLSLKRNLGRMVAEGFGSGGRGGRHPGTHETEEAGMQELGRLNNTDRLGNDIKVFAADNPEKAAEMVQAWITESEHGSSHTVQV
jgi:flagellar M-ring protein FliF